MNMHANIRVAPVKRERRTLWRIFAVPVALGVLSAIGLVAALVGDDVWDWLSWAALAIPIAIIAYFMTWPARAH
jgi:hypothetical protein